MFLDESSSVDEQRFGLGHRAVEIEGDAGKMCGHGVNQSSKILSINNDK
jgi:hypothetical protein